jgi:hypothetical protein
MTTARKGISGACYPIVSIISRFDVCAVLEFGSNLRAFIMTDVTKGKKRQ